MKKVIEKAKKIFSKPKNKLLLSWSILGIIVVVLFFCFVYPDILTTAKHSINLFQTLYNGHPLGFYSINYGLVIDKYDLSHSTANYELPIYFIFAIWNFPLWIAQNFFHVSITESFLCLIWIKSMLLVFLGLCVWEMKKICHEINIDRKLIPWVLFTFISSPLLLMPLFIMDQYDIIPLFFILLGLLMYIKGNFKWFLIFFAVAIPIKIFALFIFIPLILLKHKKILQIIKYAFLGLIPLLLTKLISFQMPMYKESQSVFTDNMLPRLFVSNVNVNFGNASLFCIAMIAISIFCYTKIIENRDELNKFSIYVPLLVFSCFLMFVPVHPQWFILITPFITLMLFQNMKKFKINIILDIIASGAILISTIFIYYWVYSSWVMERMVIPKLFGSTRGMNIQFSSPSVLLTKFGIDKFLPLFLAAFVTCIAAMLIINFPHSTGHDGKISSDKVEWGLLIFRTLIIIPIPILIVFCYYHIK